MVGWGVLAIACAGSRCFPPTPPTLQVGSCIQAPPVTSWAAVLPSSGPGSMGPSRATSARSRTRTTGYTVGAGAPLGNGDLSFQLGRGWGQSSALGLLSLLGGSTGEAPGGTHAQHVFHSLSTGDGVLPPE